MITSRRFWYNLTAGILAVGWQFVCMGIFFVGYMPTLAQQKIDQQVTIIASLVMFVVFFAAEVAVIVASIVYERPSQHRVTRDLDML